MDTTRNSLIGATLFSQCFEITRSYTKSLINRETAGIWNVFKLNIQHCACWWPNTHKLHLERMQLVAHLSQDILQCNLLHDTGVFARYSCVYNVSVLSWITVPQKKMLVTDWVMWQNRFRTMCCEMMPSCKQSCICCKHMQLHVNTTVVLLYFYCVAHLSSINRTACHVWCKK